jgi:hypothetical protein
LVEKERRLISERTKAGLAAAKLGGRNAQSDPEAAAFAEPSGARYSPLDESRKRYSLVVCECHGKCYCLVARDDL